MPADEGGPTPARVAGLVLAAGAGRRYGMPKALVPYDGSLLVERACRLVAEVCGPVFVVLGAAADDVRERADLGAATVVVNPDWDTGMGSSLRTGLTAIAAFGTTPGGLRQNRQPGGLRQNHQPGGLRQNHQPGGSPANRHFGGLDTPASGGLPASRQNAAGRGSEGADAVLVHLVDLPGMTVAALRRVAGYAAPDVLAVGSYAGVRGHPVLIGRIHWAGVAAHASGDQGARGYLAAHEVTEIDCSDVADPADLDYPPA